MERSDCSATVWTGIWRKLRIGFLDKEAQGSFYRWCLTSSVLVELMVLMLKFNCSINRVLEHREHREGVFLVTVSVERRKLSNDSLNVISRDWTQGLGSWSSVFLWLNFQKFPHHMGQGLTPKAYICSWLWTVQVDFLCACLYGNKTGSWLFLLTGSNRGSTAFVDRCVTTRPDAAVAPATEQDKQL